MNKIEDFIFVDNSSYNEIIIHACDLETAIHNLNDIVRHPQRYKLEERFNITYSKK